MVLINRRDFGYEFKTLSGRPVLQMLDRSDGNKLMNTENMEWALNEIRIMNPTINLRNRMILIQTTERRWEGYDPAKKVFAMLDAPSPGVAASAFVTLKRHHNESASSHT